MAKTLRQLIDELSDEALDLECTSFKITLKTPRGSSFKSDYSARRARQLDALKDAVSR